MLCQGTKYSMLFQQSDRSNVIRDKAMLKEKKRKITQAFTGKYFIEYKTNLTIIFSIVVLAEKL